MKCWVLALAFVLFAVPSVFAADGTFRGKVVDPPENAPSAPGWIFIQGKNNMLRRVNVSHAEILFADDVPEEQHRKCSSECLSPGQEVRVTARQDSSGEWQAKQVEILKIASRTADNSLQLVPFYKSDRFCTLSQITQGHRFCIAPSTEKSNSII